MAPTDKDSTDAPAGKHELEGGAKEGTAGPDAKKAKTVAVCVPCGQERPDWKEWKMDDGTVEKIVDITEEPRHHLDFTNKYGRSFTIKFPSKDTTLAHSHFVDTIIILLMKGGIKFINHVMGNEPKQGCMCFKEVGFAPFTSKPCVHKITNLSDEPMFCINVEVMERPPVVQSDALEAPCHSLVMTKDNCRVYKFCLEPGESATVSYKFFHVRVVIEGGKVEMSLKGGSGSVTWEETPEMGDIGWREPCVDVGIKNTGDTVYEAYICEWR